MVQRNQNSGCFNFSDYGAMRLIVLSENSGRSLDVVESRVWSRYGVCRIMNRYRECGPFGGCRLVVGGAAVVIISYLCFRWFHPEPLVVNSGGAVVWGSL